MVASTIYILISIIVFLILLVFIVRKNKKEEKITTLAWFAFAFIFAGLFFGDSRLVSYSLMGVGILLAVIDIFRNLKNKQKGGKNER